MWRASLILPLLLLTSCTTVYLFQPPEIAHSSGVPGWPREQVRLTVEDVRPNPEESAEVLKVTEGAVRSLLADQPPTASGLYRMEVRLLAHRATFETGNPFWSGATAFQVRVFEPLGTLWREWSIGGASRKWNWWGYWTARSVSDEAFERAVTDLRLRMIGNPLPR